MQVRLYPLKRHVRLYVCPSEKCNLALFAYLNLNFTIWTMHVWMGYWRVECAWFKFEHVSITHQNQFRDRDTNRHRIVFNYSEFDLSLQIKIQKKVQLRCMRVLKWFSIFVWLNVWDWLGCIAMPFISILCECFGNLSLLTFEFNIFLRQEKIMIFFSRKKKKNKKKTSITTLMSNSYTSTEKSK